MSRKYINTPDREDEYSTNKPVDPSLLQPVRQGFFTWLTRWPEVLTWVVLGGLVLGCFLFALCGESVHSQIEKTNVLMPE